MDVTPAQILSVEVKNDYGVPFVLVALDDTLQRDLAALTAAHVGQVGRIRVCGRVVSEPVLQAAITTPAFVISTDDAMELRRLATVLRGQDLHVGCRVLT